jgi:hypothetical protein
MWLTAKILRTLGVRLRTAELPTSLIRVDGASYEERDTAYELLHVADDSALEDMPGERR